MSSPSPYLFQFRHGDHICVFHRSDNSLMDVLTPYIAEGLRKGQRCFCVQRAEVVKRLEYDLRFIGTDVDTATRVGALEFRSVEEAYLPNGKFEPGVMMDMHVRSIEDAVKKGFSGFRSAGDLSWSVKNRTDCSQILGYEAMVEECFPGKPATGLCQYPMEAFPPDVLKSVMSLHRQRVVEPAGPSCLSSLSVSSNHCVTEIIADKFVVNPRYYYVVEQQDCRDVLGWGSAPDFNAASLQAESLVRQISSNKYTN